MSYFLDIKGAFLDYTNGDIKEALMFISDIFEDMNEEGLYGYISNLKDEAIDNDLCPECFGYLQPTEIGEDITEAWGRKEVTPITALICEDCGEIVE